MVHSMSSKDKDVLRNYLIKKSEYQENSIKQKLKNINDILS